MPLLQLEVANLGKSKTGLSGSVGYTVLKVDGTVQTPRTNAGVYETVTGSGIYAAYVSYPNDFNGSIVWDTGETPAFNLAFAGDEVNYQANNPNVDLILSQTLVVSSTLAVMSGTLAFVNCNVLLLRDMTVGRWKIDTAASQMIFFKEDNVTEVARFNLYDATGTLSANCPTERVLTGSVASC